MKNREKTARLCHPHFFRCADPELCFADEQGQLYVNPTTRLALKGHCSVEDGSNCQPDMKYSWMLQDQNLQVTTLKYNFGALQYVAIQ